MPRKRSERIQRRAETEAQMQDEAVRQALLEAERAAELEEKLVRDHACVHW